MEDLRKMLKDTLKQMKVTQTELSERSGVRYATICNFLNDKKDIRLETFLKLIDALGITLSLKINKRKAPK